MLGYPREEIIGLNMTQWDDGFTPEIRDTVFRRQFEHPTRSQFETRHRRKDGSVYDAEISGFPLQLDGKPVLFNSARDITGRKRIERNLTLAVEATQVVIWELDLRCGRLIFDHAQLPLLGLAADAGVDSLDDYLGLLHPEDRQAFQAMYLAFLEPGDPLFDFEYRLSGDGRDYQWIHTKGRVAQRSVDGQPELAVGSSMNISPRKQIEAAIRSSEEHARNLAAMLRLMCDNVPDMIWAKDLDKKFLFANRAICDQLLHATDTDEPLGKTDLFFARRERAAHADDPQWHTFGELCQDSDAITLERGESSVFEEYGNIRGEMVYLDVHKAPFRNEKGEIIGTVGSARDITERKRIEAELDRHRLNLEELVQQRTAEFLATEARASHILQSSADGLYGMDAEGRITFINPAACEMLGYRPEEAIGRHAHALFHPRRPDGSPYPLAECPSHQAMREGQNIRVDNEVFWHADGHPVPVMFAMHPMIQDGRVSGAVTSFVDMSAQHAAAEAREQALLVAENLARVRSEFLANMSHEIRTPINGVLGFAEIGYRNHRDSEKARNAFEKIRISGKRLLGVINDILDFSKIDAGQFAIAQTQTLLQEVVDHSVDLVREQARAKGLALRVEMDPNLPRACLSDPLRLGQVLLNLLNNAIKFTDAGQVVLHAHRRGERLVFSIADSGIGMDGAQLERLFNPFQQLDGSATRRYGGTGLGLAISRRILELMGGDIRVDSRPEAGSTFEFSLPYLPSPTPAAPPLAPPAPPTQPLAGLRILVAEDEAINQMVLDENLTEDGALVTLVDNGREAVERVRQAGPGAFDIVLMDVQMPEMDGLEATRRLLELAPGLPIVGQTAHAFAQEMEKCLAAGMVEHIAKPIDPALLVEILLRHTRR